jgi:catechol 2,3-dioxygenase-like lactoylglutathione lyase family enzyme
MPTRYIVHDVESAVEFYTERLGFDLVETWGTALAIVRRDDTTLWLSGPSSSAARPMPDGACPEPGGWNRVVVEADDIESLVESLKVAGVRFRNDPISGPGGAQVLLEDPSGNPVELFQARRSVG